MEVMSVLVPKQKFPSGGSVNAYFNTAFNLLWNNLYTPIINAINQSPTYQVIVTGHSLGGALASQASTMLAYSNITIPYLYTFGQPRVGSYYYARSHDHLVHTSYRVVHGRDVVPHVPFCGKIASKCIGYTFLSYHHGKEIWYSTEGQFDESSSFDQCTGLPKNEAWNCSNGKFTEDKCIDISNCINQHYCYFGVAIGDFGANDCQMTPTIQNKCQ